MCFLLRNVMVFSIRFAYWCETSHPTWILFGRMLLGLARFRSRRPHIISLSWIIRVRITLKRLLNPIEFSRRLRVLCSYGLGSLSFAVTLPKIRCLEITYRSLLPFVSASACHSFRTRSSS